jgi:hypothetical protein
MNNNALTVSNFDSVKGRDVRSGLEKWGGMLFGLRAKEGMLKAPQDDLRRALSVFLRRPISSISSFANIEE